VEIPVGDPWEDGGVNHAQAVNANHLEFGVDYAHPVLPASHAAGAAGMIGAFDILPDEIVKRSVRGDVRSGRNLPVAIGPEGLLRKDFPRQPDAMAEIPPVILMRHVIE